MKAWPLDPLVLLNFKLEVSEKLPQGLNLIIRANTTVLLKIVPVRVRNCGGGTNQPLLVTLGALSVSIQCWQHTWMLERPVKLAVPSVLR